MSMKRVSMWIAAIVMAYTIYYMFTLQLEDAGESVYYGGLIFMMVRLVEVEHGDRKQHRVRL